MQIETGVIQGTYLAPWGRDTTLRVLSAKRTPDARPLKTSLIAPALSVEGHRGQNKISGYQLYIQHKWIVLFAQFDGSSISGYINNKLLWARKYARIVVRGYCLFREANSCPRAKLEGNCELRGTDNVQGQLSVHISEAKSSLLSLLSFKYFLSQRKQQRENKTKQNKKQNTSTSWWFLALLSQQVS